MSMFSFLLKKKFLILLLILLFNNFLKANKIENISFQDAGFSEERISKIDNIFIKAIHLSSWPGSTGEYFWAGCAGIYFWIDPKEELIVISMTQAVTNRMKFRLHLRNLVYKPIIN